MPEIGGAIISEQRGGFIGMGKLVHASSLPISIIRCCRLLGIKEQSWLGVRMFCGVVQHQVLEMASSPSIQNDTQESALVRVSFEE